MKPLNEATVAIVGLGLMGGSLALALKKRRACHRIVAITLEADVCAHALEMHAVDDASQDLTLASQADIIILATPVRVILEQLGAIGTLAKDGAVIMDLGSTKQSIVAEMTRLPPHLQAIGGHPMCGKEKSGFGAADAELFQGAAFALTPLDRTLPQTLSLSQDLVRIIGAHPLVLDAAQHDRIVAAVSHLPFLLAVNLIEAASDLEMNEPFTFALVAGGFRDTSRLAGSDTKMMLDIIATNRLNIAQHARASSARLERLANLIEEDDEENLIALLERSRDRQRHLLPGSTT